MQQRFFVHLESVALHFAFVAQPECNKVGIEQAEQVFQVDALGLDNVVSGGNIGVKVGIGKHGSVHAFALADDFFALEKVFFAGAV